MPAYWATVGRIIIALFFLSSGIGKLIGEPGALQEMIRHGFPIAVPLYWITAIFETVVGGHAAARNFNRLVIGSVGPVHIADRTDDP